MKQWLLVMVLLLSVGVNIGLLVGRVFPGRSGVESVTPGRAATGETATGQPATGTLQEHDETQGTDPQAPRVDRAPRFVERMADELRLEEENRTRFIERQRHFFEQLLTVRARFGRLQAELRRELVVETPDRQRIDAVLEEIAAAHVALERSFVDNLLDTREILGPEQERRFIHFLRRLRQAGEDARRQIRDQMQQGGWQQGERRPPWAGRDTGRQPWRQRRPRASPPVVEPPQEPSGEQRVPGS